MPSRFCSSILVPALLALLAGYAQADEAKRFYDPVEKEIEGWTVAVDPQLLEGDSAEKGAKALAALANHLQRIAFMLDDERLAELRKRRIWIERNNPDIKGMQYHPNRGWLIGHELDPRLVKHVHIPQAEELLKRHVWAKHPYVILHELAHAYHDQVLSFDEPEIVAAYESAKERGIYDKVLLYTGREVRHYALTNHKEYFAESTEAYLGVNDFYPFVRAELKQHDPTMYELLEKIWGEIK
jgi:dipeptidyl-peptidase-4